MCGWQVANVFIELFGVTFWGWLMISTRNVLELFSCNYKGSKQKKFGNLSKIPSDKSQVILKIISIDIDLWNQMALLCRKYAYSITLLLFLINFKFYFRFNSSRKRACIYNSVSRKTSCPIEILFQVSIHCSQKEKFLFFFFVSVLSNRTYWIEYPTIFYKTNTAIFLSLFPSHFACIFLIHSELKSSQHMHVKCDAFCVCIQFDVKDKILHTDT